jgi:hypothetical protein
MPVVLGTISQAIVARCVTRRRNEIAICCQSLRNVRRGTHIAFRSRQYSGDGDAILDLEVTTWHKKVHSGKIAKPIVRAAELVRNSKVVWATQNQGTKGVGAQSVLYIKTGTQEIIAHNNKKNLPAAIALS